MLRTRENECARLDERSFTLMPSNDSFAPGFA